MSWVAGLYYFNDDYQRDDIPGNIIGVPTTSQITTTTEAASVFGDLSYALTDALTLTFGARYRLYGEPRVLGVKAALTF